MEETKIMVPHVKDKLVGAVEDLEMFLEENCESEDLVETELLEGANNMIAQAHEFLEALENEEETEMVDGTGGNMDVEAEAEADDDDEELMPVGSDDDN